MLDFSFNKINDFGVRFFVLNASKFPNLQEINLLGNYYVTCSTIRLIVKNALKLQNLQNISFNCKEVDNEDF